MASDPIVITKENDGDTINFFEESSEESDVQIQRRPLPHRRRNQLNKKTKTASYRTPAAAPPSMMHPPQQQPNATLNDNMFEVFTNPDKKRHEESEEDDAVGDGGPGYGYDEDDDNHSMMDYPTAHHDENDWSQSQQQQPSAGFASIEDEKKDLLYKFYRLTSKGIPVGHKFTMSSDVQEMRNEFHRIQRDHDVKSSIRFSRRMLMACVTGIEFLNKRYDPFDVKLDGWSESVMENMDDYDNVFERLHDKYASRVSMAPEIELLLSLAGSAFMFHLTNSMFNSMPNLKDIAKQNPDILKNLMQSIHNANKPTTDDPSPPPPPSQKTVDGRPQPSVVAREMKPPAIDMSSIFGMMPLAPVGNATFPVATRVTEPPPPPPLPQAPKPIIKRTGSGSSLSSLSGISLPNTTNNDIMKIVSIDTSQVSKTRGRRKNKITATRENTISI